MKRNPVLISALMLFGAALLFPWVFLLAFEEDTTGADSLMAPDSLREAVNLSITPGRIEIEYDDGADTLILRPGGAIRETGSYRKHEMIRFGTDERIELTDSIRGGIFLFFGDLEVAGYVRGDIDILFGDLHIGSTANVEGETYCLGTVRLDSGAHIWGDIRASELQAPMFEEYYEFRGEFQEVKFSLGWIKSIVPPDIPVMLVFLVSVSLIVSLIVLILPRPIARVRYHIESGFMKCFLVGVLLTVAIFPLWILILITIIGIPIALLIFPFAVIGAYALGSIGFTQFFGYELNRRTTLRYEGQFRTTLAGIITLASLLILSTFFKFINMMFLSWPLIIVHFAMLFVMFATGLGAVFFSRFGTRPVEVDLEPDFAPGKPVAQPY